MLQYTQEQEHSLTKYGVSEWMDSIIIHIFHAQNTVS